MFTQICSFSPVSLCSVGHRLQVKISSSTHKSGGNNNHTATQPQRDMDEKSSTSSTSSASSSPLNKKGQDGKAAMPEYIKAETNYIYSHFRRIKYMEDERVHEGIVRSESSHWTMKAGVRGFDHGRNRYTNILPFDYNRVKLDVVEGHCDYINASHVHLDFGGIRDEYIATQGPTVLTTPHFWHMVVEQTEHPDVVIVMVTPIQEGAVKKCVKYWLDSVGESLDIKPGLDGFKYDLQLKCLEHEDRFDPAGIHYTKLQLDAVDSISGDVLHKRTVHHIYFDQWTDAMRPDAWEPILELSQLARSLNGKGNPMFVHCSAGVGRTGTFITMDYLLSHAHLIWDNESVDMIYAVVSKLREQRISMVQSVDQYKFCYDMLKSFMEI